MTASTRSITTTTKQEEDMPPTLGNNHSHKPALTPESDDAVYESLDSFAACFCCNPFENFLPDFIQVQGSAFDVLVVRCPQTGRIASSDFRISFDHPTTPFPPKEQTLETEHCEALLEVVDEKLGKVYFPIDHQTIRKNSRLRGTPKCHSMSRCISQSFSDTGSEQETLQLLAKSLKPGRNDVRYLFRTESRVLGMALASVYLWDAKDKVVVCDVDGTITKSNIRGIYDTIVAEKYVHCHERVCQFLTTIKNGGKERHDDENPQEDDRPNVNILYLSSRPLAIANSTRRFLSKVRQSTQQETERKLKRTWSRKNSKSKETQPSTPPEEDIEYRLPDGPLIGFPGPLTEVLKMEMVTHSVHLFKASTLLEQVVKPFVDATNDSSVHDSMFIAGFGNTMMDVQAYHMAGLKLSQIYLIDKKSRISCLDAGADQQEDEKPKDRKPIHKSSFRSIKKKSSSSSSSSSKSSKSRSNLFFDGEQLTNEEGASLKTPLKCYRKEFGTVFQGYRDDAIVSHVFSDK